MLFSLQSFFGRNEAIGSNRVVSEILVEEKLRSAIRIGLSMDSVIGGWIEISSQTENHAIMHSWHRKTEAVKDLTRWMKDLNEWGF